MNLQVPFISASASPDKHTQPFKQDFAFHHIAQRQRQRQKHITISDCHFFFSNSFQSHFFPLFIYYGAYLGIATCLLFFIIIFFFLHFSFTFQVQRANTSRIASTGGVLSSPSRFFFILFLCFYFYLSITFSAWENTTLSFFSFFFFFFHPWILCLCPDRNFGWAKSHEALGYVYHWVFWVFM